MSNKDDKHYYFEEIERQLAAKNLLIEKQDQNRPWGGFFVINEEQAQTFANHYFSGMLVDELRISGKLSPKILIVAPEKRLSWQYHHRRAEIWKVVQGKVGVVKSLTDEEGELEEFQPGDVITLKQGERHRLVGLQEWGVLAEIWQHTDPQYPSDEEDIVRIQDDFGR